MRKERSLLSSALCETLVSITRPARLLSTDQTELGHFLSLYLIREQTNFPKRVWKENSKRWEKSKVTIVLQHIIARNSKDYSEFQTHLEVGLHHNLTKSPEYQWNTRLLYMWKFYYPKPKKRNNAYGLSLWRSWCQRPVMLDSGPETTCSSVNDLMQSTVTKYGENIWSLFLFVSFFVHVAVTQFNLLFHRISAYVWLLLCSAS